MIRTTTCLILLTNPAYAWAEAQAGKGAEPWWLPSLVTFSGFIIAALVILYQLRRQHANQLAQQAENDRATLRLQIYQEMTAQLTKAVEMTNSASLYATTSYTHSVIFRKQVDMGMDPPPIAERALCFMERHAAASGEVVNVIYLIEKYMIVHPNMDIFRVAFSAAIHDANESSKAMFDFMLCHFPSDSYPTSPVPALNVKTLSDVELDELDTLAANYQGNMLNLGCYLDDMRREIQSVLLGGLFSNTLPSRVPTDPTLKVISLDSTHVDELRSYFYHHTAWGKGVAALRAEVEHELQ